MSLVEIKAIAITACVLVTVLNIISVKATGSLQILLVAILLAFLGVYIAYGLRTSYEVLAVSQKPFEGFMDKGFVRVFGTAGMVFVSFGGLTKVASVAEEVRKPGRNIPAGMFAAAFVVTLIYIAAVFVTVAVLDGETLSGSLTPLSLAAGKFLGRPGVILLSAAAMLAFITTANTGVLSASRSPMAMS